MNENGAWVGNNSNIVKGANFATGDFFEETAKLAAQLT